MRRQLSEDSSDIVIDGVAEPSDSSGLNDLDLEIDDVLGDMAAPPPPRIEARADAKGAVPRPGGKR